MKNEIKRNVLEVEDRIILFLIPTGIFESYISELSKICKENDYTMSLESAPCRFVLRNKSTKKIELVKKIRNFEVFAKYKNEFPKINNPPILVNDHPGHEINDK